MAVSVLVADDDVLVRAGFRLLLESQPDIEVVGEAADGEETVASTRRLLPDVLLVDVKMPRLNGLQVIDALGDMLGRPTRILVLTAFNREEYWYEALTAGASGFLLKTTPPERLIAAVRGVAEGEVLLSPPITRQLVERLPRGRPDPLLAAKLTTLSERQIEVLRLLGRGCSTPEIAQALFLGESSVKTHISHLLTKLDLRDRVQAVAFAYQSGLIEPGGL